MAIFVYTFGIVSLFKFKDLLDFPKEIKKRVCIVFICRLFWSMRCSCSAACLDSYLISCTTSTSHSRTTSLGPTATTLRTAATSAISTLASAIPSCTSCQSPPSSSFTGPTSRTTRSVAASSRSRTSAISRIGCCVVPTFGICWGQVKYRLRPRMYNKKKKSSTNRSINRKARKNREMAIQGSLESTTINEVFFVVIYQMMVNIFMSARLVPANILNLLNGIIFT